MDLSFLKSRKLVVVVLSECLVVFAAWMCARWAGIISLYPTTVGTLLGLATLYITGNTVHNHLTMKNNTEMAKVTGEAPDPGDPDVDDQQPAPPVTPADVAKAANVIGDKAAAVIKDELKAQDTNHLDSDGHPNG